MARPARSATPLDVTQGVAQVVPMTLYNPSPSGSGLGSPVDLTGATVAAMAHWLNYQRGLPCTVGDRTGGKFSVALSAELTAELPLRGARGLAVAELVVAVTDSAGSVRHYIYPLEVWPL